MAAFTCAFGRRQQDKRWMAEARGSVTVAGRVARPPARGFHNTPPSIFAVSTFSRVREVATPEADAERYT